MGRSVVLCVTHTNSSEYLIWSNIYIILNIFFLCIECACNFPYVSAELKEIFFSLVYACVSNLLFCFVYVFLGLVVPLIRAILLSLFCTFFRYGNQHQHPACLFELVDSWIACVHDWWMKISSKLFSLPNQSGFWYSKQDGYEGQDYTIALLMKGAHGTMK